MSFMYCIILSIMMLFSNGECKWCFKFKNIQTCDGCHVPSPSSNETIGCLPYSTIILDKSISRCYKHNFFSFDIAIPTISLLSSSITIQIQTNSNEPIFIKVSSITYSKTIFFFDAIFCGLNFWIHQFHMDTWFLLIKYKDNI